MKTAVMVAVMAVTLLVAACGAQKTDKPSELPSLYSQDSGEPVDISEFLAEHYDCEESDTVLPCGDAPTVRRIYSGKDGASIYVIGGIHGDEAAGYLAAEKLMDISVRAGKLCIISRANLYGIENNVRQTRERYDLNRNFPGDEHGNATERIAAAIYSDIAAEAPDIVLDLHEAKPHDYGDELGNSIIVNDVSQTGDVVLGLLSDIRTADGKSALTLYASPPDGSINKAVSMGLGIPVITVETDRSEELDARVSRQLEIVEYILSYYKMR